MTRTLSLIFKEMSHRRANALLALGAVAAAVAVYVALSILHAASIRETERIQRDMGFNLRILPAATDLHRFYSTGYSEHTLAEDAADRLAAQETLVYNHILPTLSGAVKLTPVGAQGATAPVEAIITGLGEPRYPPGQQKPAMIKPIGEGKAHLGSQIAAQLGAGRGDTVLVNGSPFVVERVAPEAGSAEDLRVLASLPQVQRVLQLPGRINEIRAIDCLCLEPEQDPLGQVRAEIAKVLPEAKVLMISSIADARARQRQMMENFVKVAAPLVLLAAAAWVAALAMINVKQRTSEIGLMRALGYRSRAIAGLLLGRAAIIGLVGAVIGYAMGAGAALAIAPGVFKMTAKAVDAAPIMLLWAAVAAPAAAALASFIPAALAVAQDPARTLRED